MSYYIPIISVCTWICLTNCFYYQIQISIKVKVSLLRFNKKQYGNVNTVSFFSPRFFCHAAFNTGAAVNTHSSAIGQLFPFTHCDIFKVAKKKSLKQHICHFFLSSDLLSTRKNYPICTKRFNHSTYISQ